jgi:acetyl esterase/lipase
MVVPMGDMPLSGAPAPAGVRGLATRARLAAIRASLLLSPRPMAMLIRRSFAEHGRALGTALLAQAPSGISANMDEQYGPHPDELFDVYAPAEAAEAGRRLPVVLWVHGGAFVGGCKEELDGYLRTLAHAGFTVVGLRYSLAPEAHYPTPVRQVFAALRYLQANADRLHVDPTSLVLAGDSAGAQIAAQAAALVTNPEYALDMGIEPTIRLEQLRGVALCCGIFDFTHLPPRAGYERFMTAVGWAYSGTRDFRRDQRFISTVSVANNVTGAFPPTFLTAGNADPLAPQSTALAATLGSCGVDVETLFHPADHTPPLGHEYQFDLHQEDGRAAVWRLTAFFERCTREPDAVLDAQEDRLRC